MDGLRYAGELSPQRRMRPLVRLHVSLLGVPGLSRTDRLRFLKGYFTGFGTAPRAWRQAWSGLQEAADKKVRAHDARRAWKLRKYGRE